MFDHWAACAAPRGRLTSCRADNRTLARLSEAVKVRPKDGFEFLV
jgi:hypothetical protein